MFGMPAPLKMKLLPQRLCASATLRANSEVLPEASVAVAVTCVKPGSVLKVAEKKPSNVGLDTTEVMNSRPSPKPDESSLVVKKSSTVELGGEEPCTVNEPPPLLLTWL